LPVPFTSSIFTFNVFSSPRTAGVASVAKRDFGTLPVVSVVEGAADAGTVWGVVCDSVVVCAGGEGSAAAGG